MMKIKANLGRVLLFGSLVLLQTIGLFGNPLSADKGKKWFRGQLHCHTYLSDGQAFPEQVATIYKQRGYNFLAITDHNHFADDKDVWREIAPTAGKWPPKVTQGIFDSYIQQFGKDWVDVKTNGAITSVRLKTYEEVKARSEEPGKFILIPGVEATQAYNGINIHTNYINLPVNLPCIKGPDLVKKVQGATDAGKIVAINAAEAKQAAAQLNRPYLLMLNHPFWVYWDIRPEVLMACPEVRFFEIANGGSRYAPDPQALSYTPDKFWDIVNAFRSIRNQPLLFGVGSDDTHDYDPKHNGVGDAWVMVHADSLSPDALLSAMHQGDFYATTGVQLDEVAFNARKRTLRVKVKPEPGVDYRIDFITTREGYNQQFSEVKSQLERTIPLYSDEIGQTVKTVKGTEASYKLQPGDLYVRARVESTTPCLKTPHFHPKFQTAWTQPYTTRKTAKAE